MDHWHSKNSSLVRSLCRSRQSDWFDMVRYMMVSSANNLMFLLMESGMSLIYMGKRMDPVCMYVIVFRR